MPDKFVTIDLLCSPDGNLEGPGLASLKKFDAVLSTLPFWKEKTAWGQVFGIPCYDMFDFIEPVTTEDYRTFEWAFRQLLKLTQVLPPIQVEGINFVEPFALHLEAVFRTEATLSLAMERLRRRGVTNVAIIGNPVSINLGAGLRRLVRSCGWRCVGNFTWDGINFAKTYEAGLSEYAEQNLAFHLSEKLPENVKFAFDGATQKVLEIEGEPKKGGILLNHFSGNDFYLRHTLPVLKVLRSRNIPVSYFGYGQQARNKLPSDMPGFYRNYVYENEIESLVDGVWQRLAKNLAQVLHDGVLSENWGLFQLFERPNVIRSIASAVAVEIVTYRTALDYCEPRAIWCGTTSTPSDIVAANLASLRDIPTIGGFATSVDYRLRSQPVWPRNIYIAAYGTQVAEDAVKRGVLRRAVKLVGAPQYDHLSKTDSQSARTEIDETFNLDSSHKLIVVATSRLSAKIEDEWLIPLARWCRKQKNINLLVSPHPDYISTYDTTKARLEELKEPGPIWSTVPSMTSIAASDVFITDCSTCGIEAAIMRKTMIAINGTGEAYDHNDYAEMGVAFPATNKAEVIKTVSDLTSAPELGAQLETFREMFLKKINWNADGFAAERIADWLHSGIPALPVTKLDISEFIGLTQHCTEELQPIDQENKDQIFRRVHATMLEYQESLVKHPVLTL
jgi:hypothetical protein